MLKKMNRQCRLLCIVAAAVGFTSCDTAVDEKTADQIRPVKTIVVGGAGAGGERRFPGRIESAKRVELAFRVPGKLNELPVKEGDEVVVGAVIAKLDDADFKTAYNDRNAVFTRTSADYKRAQELVKDGFISRVDYDKVERITGINVTVCTSATNDAEGKSLLSQLGMPFRQ